MKMCRFARRSIVALALVLAAPVFGQKNVVQPGDPIIASSSNGPGSEGVANAIDGKTTKYLNFDSRLPDPIKPSGFIVSPSVGVTWVTGMRIQSANDEQDRDPKTVILAGSNADTPPVWDDAAWEPIATIDVPDYTDRFQWQDFSFPNFKAYKHYQWKVTQTRNSNTCCMQVAEVELIGRTLPQDITQPGDPIIASSSNGPGSEGVANAIDNKTTKYLNFDSRLPDPIKPSGFVVSPQFGRSVVVGMTIQSANDEQDRDPKTVILSGSNADTAPAWDDPSWETVQTIDVPDFADRFQTQTFLWNNVKPYKHYQWKVTQTRNSNTCCMQVAEVELLGTPAPKDVTQPGDPIVASSSNGPGSEGVANAIDNKTTKYLNFDSRLPDPIKPSGFIVSPSIGATTLTGMTIQSANDEQDRDPKTVILSGSNADTAPAWDDPSWETVQTIDVPDFTDRFQTQEFFFANSKSYKHYQWKVTQTRNSNTCCMQVAEVELLAVQEGADCTKAKFLSQPINQPVLLGSKATFNTTVNGPWPLQWTKNGQPIPGATGVKFTTEAITDASMATNIYGVTIVGCESSLPVQAVIFNPSSTKSVAVTFTGGGANGAPTAVADDDILGIQLQAHWNNATMNADGSVARPPNSGSLPDPAIDPPQPVLDSDGNATDITFTWDTGGTWGSGTGQTTATDRMLNGLAGRAGTGANTFTFGNVPAGTHSVLVYTVSPPLQFQTVSYNIGTTTYYMRAMNSDEYNASPGFFRGSGTSAAGATIGDYVRFDNVSPDADGNIVLTTDTIVSAAQATGVNGIQLVLNTTAGGPAPVITVEPSPVVAAAGQTARLSVTATGAGLTYQWRKAGHNLSNGGNISGVTTSELTISDFSAADVGVYSVAVFNANGSVISKNATANLSTYSINDALVGYWKLDETTGTTGANSAPGAAANSVAVVNGTATWAPAQVNGGITLDGATFLFVTNYPKATKAISGAAWVNIQDPNLAADAVIFRNAQGNLDANSGGGQFEVGLTLVTLPDGVTTELHPMAAVAIGPNIARAIGSTAFPTGSWHQIAFSADGAQIRVYVDGQQVAVTDYLADINPPSIQYISMGEQLNLADPTDPTSLGPDASTPKVLIGQLDDVALWNRALTASEVGLVYQAGVAHKAVTTVVESQPTQQPKLTTGVTGNTLTINFDAGKLQSSPVLGTNAVWTDVTNPTTSPHSETIGTGLKFFRALVGP